MLRTHKRVLGCSPCLYKKRILITAVDVLSFGLSCSMCFSLLLFQWFRIASRPPLKFHPWFNLHRLLNTACLQILWFWLDQSTSNLPSGFDVCQISGALWSAPWHFLIHRPPLPCALHQWQFPSALSLRHAPLSFRRGTTCSSFVSRPTSR